jgi:hypothetical protein
VSPLWHATEAGADGERRCFELAPPVDEPRVGVAALTLVQDKWMTARVLRTIGVPAARNQRVPDVSQALELAQR